MAAVPGDCVANAGIWQFVIGCVIVLGIGVSYIPQQLKILLKKSSEGISSHYLMLGTASAMLMVPNTVLLQMKQLKCCSILVFRDCLTNIFPVIQLGLQFLMLSIIFVLFVAFFPASLRYTTDNKLLPPFKKALAATAILCVLFLMVLGLSLVFSLCLGPHEIVWYAWILGILSTVMSLCQYLPQLFMTFKAKCVGALSIPMMLIQTPGSFVFVYTLATAEGTNASTWLPLLVTGCLQGILLAMCIVFHFQQKRRQTFIHIEDDGREVSLKSGADLN